MYSSAQSGPQLRESVLAAKAELAQGRTKLRRQHASDSPGTHVCARLTKLLETVVLGIHESILADLPPDSAQRLKENAALVPYGGFGRREMAPFSDVDLMLLYHPSLARDVQPLARRLVMDLGDAGIVLGFSVRTTNEACQLALSDATILTSLAEARPLVGGEEFFARFAKRFKRQIGSRWRRLVGEVVEARREERSKYGETVYLLEPNIKRSRGALRDLQLVRWIGFIRYGFVEPGDLRRAGFLTVAEERSLREAREFLLRLRNEMHFHSGKSNDHLDRVEQLRLADLYGYQGDEGVLPVERFMQDYFRHTGEVRNIAASFVRAARPRSLAARVLEPLISHQVEGDFRVGPQFITATRRGRSKLAGDLSQVLRLMDLANLYNKRIDDDTWATIRKSMMAADDVVLTRAAIDRFLSILSQPAQLGELLRRLHELCVLEKIVPEFRHARCLLQFNEYHKYTVDAHCIRAVEVCTEFQSHPGRLGKVYRSLTDKRLLHLALLLHDLGKGNVEDHSELGARIAQETARRLKLSSREEETLRLLVHRHLLMSHLAFRRDISDEQVVVKFAVEVGSPDVLKMLYVLTCADLGAVGPEVLNNWKLDLLTELYHRAMAHLAGNASLDADEFLREHRQRVRLCVTDKNDADWYKRQIDALSAGYLFSCEPTQIADDLARVRHLPPRGAVAWGSFLPQRGVVQYTIGTYEQISPGLFHRLTGALSSSRLQILSAEINTLADGLVLDRFHVQDDDFAGAPPQDRIDAIARRLETAACDQSGTPPKFRQLWRSQNSGPGFTRLPTRVRFDNDTSKRYTVVDVFAHDRMGLLYTITRTLFECGVSVSVAKIGTYLDQVVDVFYVTDQTTGAKINDEQRIEQLRHRLLDAIDGPADEKAAS